jgi:uncharacterized membrane protein YjdF
MSKSDRLALVFTILYLLIAVPYARLVGNQEFIFYIAVMVVLVATVAWVHLRVGLHPACIWMLSLWGALHMAGGLVQVSDGVGVLYNLWLVPERLKYDQLVHAYGFGVATWVVWQGLCAGHASLRPTIGMLFIVFCAGMGLGALNEVVEFVAVLTMPKTNVGGYVNTGWDLVANAVGALVAVVAIRVFWWRSVRAEVSDSR